MADKKVETRDKSQVETRRGRRPVESSGSAIIWVEATRPGQYPADGGVRQIGEIFPLMPYTAEKHDEDGNVELDPETQEPVTRTVSAAEQFSYKWMKKCEKPPNAVQVARSAFSPADPRYIELRDKEVQALPKAAPGKAEKPTGDKDAI